MHPETLYYIGISQCLFVALVLLTKKAKQGSDYMLLAWLLTISFKMMILMISAEHGEFFDNQFSIGLIPLTFGPFLYLYTKYLLRRRFFIKSKDAYHFVPFVLFTFLYFVFFKDKLLFDAHTVFKKDGYVFARIIYATAFLSSVSFYTFKTYVLLRKHRKQLKDRFSYFSESNELNWLYVLMAIFSLTYVLYFALGAVNIYKGEQYFDIAYSSDIFLTIMAFAVSYFGIKQPYLFKVLPESNKDGEEDSSNDDANSKDNEKYKNSNLGEDQKEKYLEHIFSFMQAERPYLNPELTVQDLSKQLNISRHHLTEILNNNIGKNFFTFINEYRIEEVKKRLLDPKFEHLTIVALAFESGFNSKSTFNSIFKQNTGMTPSQWKNEQLEARAQS
ncbi:MAG: AraC family transcriptional regulator [Chitinophagales bacterium]|nr:AraC family transcriptional regulator [Bacteroidota bacterium]MCB9255666.1 AraC family transcriptional regulator [Chitinophagales bacterium]